MREKKESEVGVMIKGILDKLFKPTTKESQSISQADVEALVDARLKEHAAAIEHTINEKVNQPQPNTSGDEEDYTLSAKQVDYALSLIAKLEDFVLAIDPTQLTIKDLNRLIAYNRYKNKGTLINLVKKGVLRKK
ncbi:MAG: ABC transporter ATP-binding protein [Neobacillus sp.]